jgi:hypothetical protein
MKVSSSDAAEIRAVFRSLRQLNPTGGDKGVRLTEFNWREKMSEEINRDRRRFVGTVAMTIAAAQLGMIGSAAAQSGKAKPADLPAMTPGTNTSFGSLKQIDAGVLNVGYAEAGLLMVLP